MKPKNLLLPTVILMFTALAVTAQNGNYKKPAAKDMLQFGQKRPLPGLSKYPGISLPGMKTPGTNTAFMKGINSFNAKEIKKDPEQFKRQLQQGRDMASQYFQKNNGHAANGGQGNNGHSDFQLTRDINPLAESNPSNAADFYGHASYAILHHIAYFAADDGVHGNELWRSDGTPAGTYMVKDIEPGETSTYLYNITAVNGKIYFSAATAAYGLEPWVSDGTESGTQLLMDIKPGPAWSFPTEFAGADNKVYFVTDGDFSIYGALWKTDGTSAGTKLVKNIGDKGDGGFLISQPTETNGLLFFTFLNFSTYSWELWRSDGTHAGTFAISSNTYFPYPPAQLTRYNNKLYFSTDDGAGRKLWVSDGTQSGTTPAPGNNDILVDADNLGTTFPVIDNVLFIPGSDPATGNGLYKYDASNAAGVVLVKDLTSGTDPDFIAPSEMEVAHNTLYFKVTNYNGGAHDELWNSKGSKSSTQRVKIFLPGETTSSLHAFSGNLFFVKYDAVYGTELWKSDGTGAGTVLASDIFKGVTSSYPAFLTNLQGKLLFGATDELKGNELFFTDDAGYTIDVLKDINTVSTSSSNAGYFGGTAVLGDDVFFTAYERVHNYELYRSNGSSQGTYLLHDISPGETASYPNGLMSKDNEVYFITQILTQTGANTAIYKTDGSKNGLRKITPDFDANQYYISSFKVADNGIVFFAVINFNTFSYELWRSDGTAAGTFVLSSGLYFDFTYYRFADYLNVVGNTAFFAASDNKHGVELWKSDGSLAGTVIVKNINPGSDGAFPAALFVFNNEVYFGALDGINPYFSFWKSDGTNAGTVKLANIDPWWGNDATDNPFYFCVSNNTLFFSAVNHSDTKGTKLWKTDGTAAGTVPIKDIDPTDADPFYPFAYKLTDVNGTVFFIGEDADYNTLTLLDKKLWKSDGTKGGTQILKDITNDPDGVAIANLTSFGGKLFFSNSGSLWSSDGTVEGTLPVDDAGLSGVQVLNIVATSEKLFITGSNKKYGVELYAGEIDDETGKFATARVSDESAKTVSSFNASVYPNPAVSKTMLQLTGNTKNVSVTISDMSGKKLWQSSNINTSIISLPTEKFAAGMYIVTVVNGKGSKTITLVKQ